MAERIVFEQIVPWNGANDTGRDVRLKWQRNFEKISDALLELQLLLDLFALDANDNVYVKNDRNFYSYGTVASLGTSSGSGSSTGFNEQAMWNALATSGNQKIDASHLPLGSGLTVVNGQITASAGAGSVTSVGLSVPTGLTVANSPITSSGTLAISLATGYVIPTEARLAAIERITALFDLDANGAVYVKNDRNFYSYGTVASLGSSSAASGSSSFSWAELTANDASKVIHISHIPNIPYSKITGAPTVSQQTVSLSSGTNNGTLKLTVGSGVTDNIAVKGLAAAAYKGVVTTLDNSANLPTSAAVKTALDGYLPATRNSNGTYTVDLTRVTFTGLIVSEEDVVIYGSGSSSGSGGGSTTIINNLTSTATDAALSANMGRYLKSLIDNIDVSGLDLSGYVNVSGTQTITGSKTFNATIALNTGAGIKDVGGAGLLVYRPSSGWNNISSTQWGLGSADSQGVIRSSASDLLHFRNNTQYTILDSYNVGSYAATVNHTHSNYVTLDTEQTITAIKQFNTTIRLNGYGIEDVSGAGLLVYHPVGSWSGISSSQWGVGAANSEGVIRSNASHLIHYRGGSTYNILDTYNAPTYSLGIYPYGGTAIASNDDLDDYVSVGTYYCQTGTIASSLSNTPYKSGNFRLWNIFNTGTSGSTSASYFSQLILAPNNARLFIRRHDGSSFGSWKEIAFLSGNAGSIVFSENQRGIKCDNGTVNMSFIIGNGGTNRGIWDNTANEWMIYKNSNNHTIMAATSSLRVGIGITSPTQKLHVDGNILATGDVLMYSDRRLKTGIKPLELRGELNPVSYIKDGKPTFGFIAQEVDMDYPEVVDVDNSPEHYMSLNHQGILAIISAELYRLKREFQDYKRSKGDI